MEDNFKSFVDIMLHPAKFRMFLFRKVPAAFFSGLRAEELDEKRCVISVPFKWFNQNPFRSTYFASLSMAAEMSTGALAMAYLYRSEKPVSLLVTSIRGNFFKKAIDRTYFTCEAGEAFATAIASTKSGSDAQTVTALSTGRNKSGELIAEFEVTWSFKARTR